MENWKNTTLGEVLTLQRGFDLPSQQRILGDVPIVSSSGISGFHSEAKVKAPGVVTGRYGTIGQVYYIKEDFFPLNTTLYVKDFKGNDEKFVSYLLQTINFYAHSDKSSVPGVNRNDLHTEKVVLPPIEEQKAIAKILSSLDDKIQLNRQINATLEAMAQTLFKTWFVDFEPVYANSENRPSKSASPEIAKLFPSTFENKIPKDWSLKRVGDEIVVFDFVANGSFESLRNNVQTFDEPNFALYLRTTDYNSNYNSSLRYVDEPSFNFLSKSVLAGDETIISNVGDVGTVFRPPKWIGLPMTLGSNAVGLRSQFPSYIFRYFESYFGQHQIQSITTGSAQLKFNKTNLRDLKILFPSENVAAVFNDIENLIYDKENSNNKESKQLKEIRDSLLPRLISGKISVENLVLLQTK